MADNLSSLYLEKTARRRRHSRSNLEDGLTFGEGAADLFVPLGGEIITGMKAKRGHGFEAGAKTYAGKTIGTVAGAVPGALLGIIPGAIARDSGLARAGGVAGAIMGGTAGQLAGHHLVKKHLHKHNLLK